MYKSLPKRISLSQWDKLGKEIFNGATAILPICKYLEKITNEHVPNQKTDVFFEGIDASQWYKTNGMKLKHPCVGLLQSAIIWDKTKEMLILENILEKQIKSIGAYKTTVNLHLEITAIILIEVEKYEEKKS